VEVAMEFELKAVSPEAVARALAKADRYRLLNEPGEAESICRDALRVEPDNQEVLITLVLALTDQFDHEPSTVVEASAGFATSTSARTTRGSSPSAGRRHGFGTAHRAPATRRMSGCGTR
jgi:hypothetical protein